jgi:hypothetical protein
MAPESPKKVAKEQAKPKDKKELIKQMLKELKECDDTDAVKERFKEVLRTATADEIARAEEELVREGLPREELHSMCDVHLEVFKESIERERRVAPEGHPVRILMEEHEGLLRLAEGLKEVAKGLLLATDPKAEDALQARLDRAIADIKASENHYLREENVLFPYLERHGVSEPPKIMWMEHDQIRELKRGIYELSADFDGEGDSVGFAQHLGRSAQALTEMLSSHFYKENNILFPMALKFLSEGEWTEVRAEFDEIGYTPVTPVLAPARTAVQQAAGAAGEGMVQLPSGPLSLVELASILDALPVDISFVDAEGHVRYFNETPERIFTRTRAVIGRTVEGCHPQKSLHAVDQILEDFKAGKREKAEFWINLKGRLVLIRYFPVRGRDGAYLGCLEVTQDVTDLKRLEGQKRLLD